MFRRNEGMIDRLVRVALAVVSLPTGLAWLGFWQGGIPAAVLAGFGTLMLVTGITGVCALYIPFGISTLEKEKELIDKCMSMAAACPCSGSRSMQHTHTPDPQTTGENAPSSPV